MNQQSAKTEKSTEKTSGRNSSAATNRVESAPTVQTAAGNLAVQRFIQAKMQVSQPDDPYEQEADRVAEQVMRKPSAESVQISSVRSGIHRKCKKCDEEEEPAGMVQPKRKSNSHDTDSGSVSTAAMANRGQPLSRAIRSFFEPRFGYDFSGVRVHTDFSAQTNNRNLQARAFTFGNHIAFNQGEYAPHTDNGKSLLAHELTHVVQQSGGHRSTPAVQANGGEVSEEDLAALREFMNNNLAQNPDPNTAQSNTGVHSQSQWPALTNTGASNTNTALGWYGQSNTADSSGFGGFPSYEVPRIPEITCPGTCHQIAQSHAAYAQQRMAAANRRRRLAAWPGMHAEQHQQELDQQPTTLEDEINTSEMATMQMRGQLFESAIQAGSTRVNAEMREKWAAAQQATLFLDMLFKTPDGQIPPESLEKIRTAYQEYFAAMVEAVLERDAADRRMYESFDRRNDPCPSCHDAVQPNLQDFGNFAQFDSLLPQQPADPTLLNWINELSPPVAEPEPEPHIAGAREQQLGEAGRLASSAADRCMWRQVISHFRWATGEMDQILVAAAPQDRQTQRLVQQFEYTRDLLTRQRAFYRQHPTAVKVQAVFYPKPESVADLQQRPGEDGFSGEDYARGIPWQFYLTHTPVDDPSEIPVGFEWQLHDITAAQRKKGRTVKRTYEISNIERNMRYLSRGRAWMDEPSSILETNPPDTLFNELDHKDFFPEGHLYYQYPSNRRQGGLISGDVQTNASTTFWEWVGYIGMSAAILGSLVFAPFSTPMLVAVIGGTGLSALGGYMRLQEKQEHGVATEKDVNQFYWGLALDIMSALTLGMGRVATGAMQAGNMTRAASTGRLWFMLQRTELAMNAVNVGVVAYDFVQQYRAIENSTMSPEEKRKALQQLTMFGMLMGTISIIPVATGIRDLRHGRALHLDVDPQNPGRTVGRFDADSVEDLQHFRSRAPDPDAVPIGGKIQGRGLNAEHTYRVWSDGRITRCSPEPCRDIAESVLWRIQLLRGRMLGTSGHADVMSDLGERARQLHLDATAAAGRQGGLTDGLADLQRRAQDLDDAMARLERDVTDESLASLRPHLSDPDEMDQLLAREWPEDLLVDFEGMLSAVARAGDYDPAHLQRMIGVLRRAEPSDIENLLRTTVQVNLSPHSRVYHGPESVWWGRLGNSEEVTLLEAQLRGYGRSLGPTQRPARTGQGTQGATLDEFSTPTGEHGITSLIGDPMPRQGLEDVILPRGDFVDTDLHQSLQIMVSERLHAVGAGFGAESGTGVAHGSSFVNQILQNQGVEQMIRFLHANRPPGIRYLVHVDVRTVRAGSGSASTRMLKRITYRVRAVEDTPTGLRTWRPSGEGSSRYRDVFEATITHPEDIRAATRPRGAGDIQGIGIDVEAGYGAMAEHFGL